VKAELEKARGVPASGAESGGAIVGTRDEEGGERRERDGSGDEGAGDAGRIAVGPRDLGEPDAQNHE
jgi:hypothetical protein